MQFNYPLMKMEQTVCSKTLVLMLQPLVSNPEESVQQHKSKLNNVLFKVKFQTLKFH
jgi:hypothetical protein